LLDIQLMHLSVQLTPSPTTSSGDLAATVPLLGDASPQLAAVAAVVGGEVSLAHEL